MFKYGISCALEPQSVRQPTVIRGEIEYVASEARRAGYDGIELFIRNPKQYVPARLRQAAKNEGLDFCAISTGMEYNLNNLCLIAERKEERRLAVSRLKEHLELGGEIQAPVVVGIMRGNIPDFSREKEYLKLYREALYELSDYARKVGSRIYVESIMRYINNYLNSAPETAVFLRDLKTDNVKLHIDTHSMLVEDRDPVQSIYETEDILEYVHFSDSNRKYPGAGNVDFKAIMGALMDVGYKGYITMECLPYPTELECARRGLNYTRHLERMLMIEKSK